MQTLGSSPPHAPAAPESSAPAKKAPGRVSLLLAGAVVFAATSLIVALVMYSLAVFTDQEKVDKSMATGTLNLEVSQPTAQVTLPSPPLVPGAQVTSALTVGNGGSVALRYAVHSQTTEDVLASTLVLTVKSDVANCDDAGWAATGTVLYAGVYGSTLGTNVIGSNAQGAQLGDRQLAPAATETLCFNVTLPPSATNAVQGLASTATFTFDAEQTTNNP